MTEILLDPESDARRLRRSFRWSLSFVALLWAIKAAEVLLSLQLVRYGVYPRQLSGLSGVLWAPLIHGSAYHLFANTAPLVVLGTALFYGSPRSAKILLSVVYIGSTTGVWLFARDAYHIGASGLTFGMMFFLFTVGALRWDRRAIAISLIVFFLYGGMIWGIFPGASGVSFESHFFGAFLGIVLAFLLKDRDPAPPQKKYSWEDEDEEDQENDSVS